MNIFWWTCPTEGLYGPGVHVLYFLMQPMQSLIIFLFFFSHLQLQSRVQMYIRVLLLMHKPHNQPPSQYDHWFNSRMPLRLCKGNLLKNHAKKVKPIAKTRCCNGEFIWPYGSGAACFWKKKKNVSSQIAFECALTYKNTNTKTGRYKSRTGSTRIADLNKNCYDSDYRGLQCKIKTCRESRGA